jgi:hypothetical protein
MAHAVYTVRLSCAVPVSPAADRSIARAGSTRGCSAAPHSTRLYYLFVTGPTPIPQQHDAISVKQSHALNRRRVSWQDRPGSRAHMYV